MAIVLIFLFVSLDSQESAIVATVDGQSIHTAEVEAELRQAYGERELAAAERQRLFQAALEQTIDRRLVLNHLTKTGEAAGQHDLAIALSQFEKELTSQNLTLAQHCEKVGLSHEDVRRALAWKVTWKRYCEKHLTPQNLEKFFERQRRDFDGTQVRIGQILFKSSGDTEAEAAKKRAAGIRQEIASGKLSFADAARQHSEAPSREAGGDIGWIERHKPMPEEFSRLAFSLKKGEVSGPFVSPFGVHVITVLDEKPGTKTWQEVQGELRPAVVLYLFRWLADKERASAKIEYSAAK
jgi:parvulin-like peptidyl-prolyl isomerase